MITESENKPYTVKLFVRADPELGCETRKQAVIEQLETLDAEGHIRTYEVNIWTKEIRTAGPLEDTPYYERVFGHFDAFQQWADDHEARLNAAFKIQSVDCEITGETYTVLSLPSLCLAVYEDGELCAVYPHSTDGQCRTISTCLDQLESVDHIEYAN